ncbi:MAG: hypothetical protein IKI03_05290 [Clostridia bacterium]|nr:hypothetical protein [Clostridia bacterium]
MVLSVPPLAVSVARTFGDGIDGDRVLGIARAMSDRGFVRAGYRYLNIGDGWAKKERDPESGSLLADESKLAGSLGSLAAELNSLGIRLAIVTSGGTRTPNGFPGSFGHEYEDASFYAENGVSMIAQDFSSLPRRTDTVTMIRRTGMALRANGDSIVYSVYSDSEDLTKYIRATGAHIYHLRPFSRASGVIFPPKETHGYSVPGSLFNCGDIVLGKDVDKTDLKRSLIIAAMASSPITVDADITSLDDETVSLLTDPDLTAVATDAECRPARMMSPEPETVMLKVLDGNRYAAAFVNDTDETRMISFYAHDMGLTRDARRVVAADERVGVCRKCEFSDDLSLPLEKKGSALFYLTLKRKDGEVK